MPTVEAYKDFIRKHKEKNCPSFSNKKKEQLKQLAERLGYTAPVKKKPVKEMKKKEPPKKTKKPKLTHKRKAEKERELSDKQEPFLDMMISIWRKADKLVTDWVNETYIPTIKRFYPLIENARTSEERQKIYNAWSETRDTLIHELESQRLPLREAYYKIDEDNKELNLNPNSFPTISRISVYDKQMRRLMKHPIKPPEPKEEPVKLVVRSRTGGVKFL